jgi:hypothetical protein
METGKAKIKLLDSFNITGRGLVFVGEIMENKFMEAKQLIFSIDNTFYDLPIIGIEMLEKYYQNPNMWGFLVKVNETESQELYKNPQLKDVIAEVV